MFENIHTMELELPRFSLNLDFGNFENETRNKRVKKMLEEELDKSVAGQHNVHYVSGIHGLNRTSLQKLRKNPLKSPRNKNFPGF